ncbi:hypothetical protein MMC22_001684 [Lobaria immixta]|nr:hypothetical protein [Lobaria immixta]
MEPTEHAETTRYPADDHSLSAPELDSAVIAPQVAVDHGPEVYYDDKSPEATNGSEKETVARSVPRIEPKSFWRRKRIVIIALLSILIAVVIVVGSVVGTKAKKSSNTSSSSDPPVSTQKSSNTGSSSDPPVSTLVPQPTALPKSGGILNDSSFAAVTLQNNDRRLFFQDHWNIEFSNNVTFDARNHTPFAVLSVLPADDPIGSLIAINDKSERIYLFYILENNTIAVTQFLAGSWRRVLINNSLAITQEIDGSWRNVTKTNVSVATDSRYLSMTRIVNQSSFEVCLFFEDSNGKVSALRGLWALTKHSDEEPVNPNDPSSPSVEHLEWTWEDNTRKLRAPLPNNSLSAPFSSSVSPDGGVLATFSNLNDDDTYSLDTFEAEYVNGTFNSTSLSSRPPVSDIDRSTAPFDLLQISPTQEINPVLFWINGTKLEIKQVRSNLGVTGFNVPESGSKTGFPYSRLGVTMPLNATAYYLYHQLDNVTIAEEKWSSETGVWVLSNITVGTP